MSFGLTCVADELDSFAQISSWDSPGLSGRTGLGSAGKFAEGKVADIY